MKFMSKTMRKLVALSIVFTTAFIFAQEPIDSAAVKSKLNTQDTIVKPFKKFKVDGVAAVVGDHVILESDIDKALIEIKNQGQLTADITRCKILGKIMEDKMYAHQAVQDSVALSDAEVHRQVDGTIEHFLQQTDGSMEKLLKVYKMKDEATLRKELFDINKTRMLSQRMQQKVVEEVEITPEEVRQFFDKFPEDDMPMVGTELEIAQIVKKPKPSEEAIQKTIEKLKAIKADVVEKGLSFKTKAILYSDDGGSSSQGGAYLVTKKSGYVKEFKDMAFTLQEGEVSDPFESEFGWHIMYLEKIRGQERHVRHILMVPEVSEAEKEAAKNELMDVREKIMNGEVTFAEAALNFSDQKETKFEGGRLRNPGTQGFRFELTNMQPELNSQIRNLKEDEISLPIEEIEPTGAISFKIMQVTNRYDEHEAEYAQDYERIQEWALTDKKVKTIEKWMAKKIKDTYIYVNTDNRSCNFSSNWLKK